MALLDSKGNTISLGSSVSTGMDFAVKFEEALLKGWDVIVTTTTVVFTVTTDLLGAFNTIAPKLSQMVTSFIGEVNSLIDELTEVIKFWYLSHKGFIKQLADDSKAALGISADDKDYEKMGRELAKSLF